MIVYIAKRLIIVVPKVTEKSPFLNARLARGVLSAVVFPSNEYNNGHPCLRQGLLIVLEPMIVYIAKRVIIFIPKFTKKSPFLNAQLVRGTLSLSGVVFPSNEYSNGHPCLRQGLLVVLVPMSFY
jgi:hypothetical protein